MTTKLEQAARQALEALEQNTYYNFDDDIKALREALAEPQITTPDVCGEVCARAKLCYGCGKALDEANAKYAEQAEQEPEYDLSNVIHLTHNKAKHIIKSRGYSVTGFVLTREDGGKCIVDMSAVRWFDDKLVFQRMMHSDTPKEWLSPPVEHVKQEPVELMGVKETIAEGGGFWHSCSGCYESNEGAPPNGATYSGVFGCYLGGGCDECGGLGAVWDNTDYEDMARFMAEQDATPVEPVKQEPVAEVVVRPLRGDQSQPTTDIKWLQRPTTGKLYAAPVRTKDLTDDEIHKAFYSKNTGLINGIRAVIAADRELNK